MQNIKTEFIQFEAYRKFKLQELNFLKEFSQNTEKKIKDCELILKDLDLWLEWEVDREKDFID